MDSLGIYISVPFCRSKCTFCHFSSDVFPLDRLPGYVDRLCREIAGAAQLAGRHGLRIPPVSDSVFFGGGTPSLLSPAHATQISSTLREHFILSPDAEITLEAAPGQLGDDLLEALRRQGLNRVSLGVQSFSDEEARAVGRLHTAKQCREEIRRLQTLGMPLISLDLILGLPHQTRESWRHSLQAAIDTGVHHISVYMLEVDEGSRLGRELIGPGIRYGAATVPDDETIAENYALACEAFAAAGLRQYEISNFAREGHESRHNRKYWKRTPYLGFGLDAHSMLQTQAATARFANSRDLDTYLSTPDTAARDLDILDSLAAFEETVFLGLRLSEGLSISELRQHHPASLVNALVERSLDLQTSHFMHLTGDRMELTPQGRLLSSSVFAELLATPA